MRLSLPSLLICHENGAFKLKRRYKPAKELILKCHVLRISVWIVRVFLKHKSKIAGDCCILKCLRHGVNRKHLMRFQSEDSVFKFPLWCIEDGT